MLRRLLVGSSHYILGPFGSDSDLRPHGQKIAPGEARTPRSERRWPWRGNSRCSCIGCGLRERYTIRSTTRIGAKSERRQLKERGDGAQPSTEEVKVAP
jgi:hypothetical protein